MGRPVHKACRGPHHHPVRPLPLYQRQQDPDRHTGIDLAIAKGTPVPASNSGRVLFAGPVIISGNTVVIEH
ncbi:MAG: M23 family metallopeptidase, partial [Firmicutes bacterium]|nr:M23 family metallopeptidase [Bacillota bacterium]